MWPRGTDRTGRCQLAEAAARIGVVDHGIGSAPSVSPAMSSR
jgi:hypothetical protein